MRKLLAPVDHVVRVVDVERYRLGRGRIAGAVLIHHHRHQPQHLAQAGRILPAGHCRLRAQIPPASSLSARPSRRSASASSTTPPSEAMRPPSKAAVNFLRLTAGNAKGNIVSSVMAGVAASDLGLERIRHPFPTPNQGLALRSPAQIHAAVAITRRVNISDSVI